MLKSLHVRDFALIDSITLDFSKGLNVLTGETGAGKSLIIDCLSLISGVRADAQAVKRGRESALIEANFDITGNEQAVIALEDLGIEPDSEGNLILSREITASGKSRARIDGRLVTVNDLSLASEALLDIFGQHELQTITRPGRQLQMVDFFLPESNKELPDSAKASFNAWTHAEGA
jgi:DNA repair protein RecN (Recombination protein N)